MADNIAIKDGAGLSTSIRTTDSAGVHTPHHLNAAGENHLGQVGTHTKIVAVALTLDTSAYAAGDVMADTQVVSNALRVNDGTGILQSITLLDKDDQTAAQIDLVFLSANVSLGTENAAPSITDSNAESILGIVSLASTDFVDVGGAKVATKVNIGLPLVAAAAGKDIYVAAIARGTPTQTSAGIVLRLGILQD